MFRKAPGVHEMLLGDLLDQLRAQNTPLCLEAAETIERLRAEVNRLKETHEGAKWKLR